ncbi:hypothetical protein B5F39_13825 [Cloacibacillus sp. An23]|nr:hypothetical protein B5F39_13825 [Cloacibacillus sp. An23]
MSLWIKILTIAALFTAICATAYAAAIDNILLRWRKTMTFTENTSNLTVAITYYSAELVEAEIQAEAEKNLWTQDELERYKYRYLNMLNLSEMIPIKVEFVNNGPTMHPGPFDKMIEMRIGSKTYEPVDYDKRLNFPFQGERDGLVFFNRFDPKTGKNLLEGQNRVTITLSSGISTLMASRNRTPRFFWDIKNDDPSKLYAGQTAARLETDRLIKRLENLRKDRADEAARLKAIDDEISTVQSRLDELAAIQ